MAWLSLYGGMTIKRAAKSVGVPKQTACEGLAKCQKVCSDVEMTLLKMLATHEEPMRAILQGTANTIP